MSHPFQVGKTYRNRKGEYVVQSIEGDRMTIRYESGKTLNTTVAIQARIWENIQFEEQMARSDERRRLADEARAAARKRAVRARRVAARPRFAGFQESDFEPKQRGIAWSSRKEAGQLLAYHLGLEEFDSWIVPRRSEVHVGRKERYDRDNQDKNAAFFVAVDDTGATYGFRVGKPDGEAKDKWPWSLLMTELADDGKVRRTLRAVMKEHDLTLDVYAMNVSYGRVGQVTVQERGFEWQQKEADQEIVRRMSWSELLDHVQEIAASKRCNLFFQGQISPEEALRGGADVVNQMVEAFKALLPVYDVCVGV